MGKPIEKAILSHITMLLDQITFAMIYVLITSIGSVTPVNVIKAHKYKSRAFNVIIQQHNTFPTNVLLHL